MQSCKSRKRGKTVSAWPGKLWIGKFLPMVLLMFLTPSIHTEAASPGAIPCTLAWDASADSNLKGYFFYYGVKGSTTTNRVDLGLTNQATLKGLLASSNYFFFVVSYDGNGISSRASAVMYYTPPPMSPLKLTPSTNGAMKVCFQAATNAACHVEYSPTLQPPKWRTLNSATADANGNVAITDPLLGKPSSRFYRAVMP
jgi:hypothetical protein